MKYEHFVTRALKQLEERSDPSKRVFFSQV